MYLTYEEYSQYSDKVEESAFSVLERKARHKLDLFTQNRIKKLDALTPDIKECMFLLIDELAIITDSEKVASFSDGSISVTYDKEQLSDDEKLYNIVSECLPLSLTSLVVVL